MYLVNPRSTGMSCIGSLGASGVLCPHFLQRYECAELQELVGT